MNQRLGNGANAACRGGWLLMALWALTGCGESTCPDGSVSMGGECVPLDESCDGGACDGESASEADGIDGMVGDAAVMGDAATTDGSTASDAGADAMPPPSPCDDVDCVHGQCVEDAAMARCECDEGFAGDSCESCAADLVLDAEGSACVTPCAGPDAPACGMNGACVEDGGTASCECTHPYRGEVCAECAEGYALQDDGTCVADCGECGDFAFCDDTPLVPECACNPGYLDDGAGCEWVGEGTDGLGLVDTDLDDPGAWSGRGVRISDGAAEFVTNPGPDQCDIGLVTQTFDMPERDQAQPFVLEMTAVPQCEEPGPYNCGALQFEINDKATRVVVAGGTDGGARIIRQCLGDAAYGEAVTLGLRPNIDSGSGYQLDCSTAKWPKVESLRIVPAREGECPLEEGLFDQSFESGDGWAVDGGEIDQGSLVLDVAGGASTVLSVPSVERLPAPALEVVTEAVQEGAFFVRLGEIGLRAIYWDAKGVGGSETTVICLPDWTHGMAHTMQVSASVSLGAAVRSISLVTDSRCGDGEFGSGFERLQARPALGAGLDGWYQRTTNPASVVIGDAASGEVLLRAYPDTAFMRLLGLVRIPVRPDGDLRTAAFGVSLRAASSGGSVVLGGEPFATLGQDWTFTSTEWDRKELCLGPIWEGQITTISFSATGTDVDTFDVDDVGPLLSDDCE